MSFKNYINLYLRNKFLVFIFLVNAVVANFFMLRTLFNYKHGDWGVFIFLHHSVIFASLSFILFIIMSYEYFYSSKTSYLLESVKASRLGLIRHTVSKLGVLFLLNFIATINVGLLNYISFRSYEFAMPGYFSHILMNIFINFFIMQAIGIFIGLSLSFFTNRIVTYGVALLLLSMGLFIFEGLILSINRGHILVYFHHILSLGIPLLTWQPNFHTGFWILSYRLWLLFIWLIIPILITLFYLIRSRRHKIFSLLIGILLIVPSFYFYIQPFSRQFNNFGPTGLLTYDIIHYSDLSIELSDPNFNVLNYEIVINLGRQLEATAKMTVSNVLPVYYFTLYHRYHITEITNQIGELMDFYRQGDYFRVYNNSEYLEQIIVSYIGYSPRFYSNYRNILLPGFFPYFPQPGKSQVFVPEFNSFKPVTLANPAFFNVTVNGTNGVFSNLMQDGENTFSGYATAVTLVNGFLNKQEINGISIIYPFLEHTVFNPINNEKNILQFIREFDFVDDVKTIIILPNIGLGKTSHLFLGDHVTAPWLTNLSYHVTKPMLTPAKWDFLNLLEDYANGFISLNRLIDYQSSFNSISFDQVANIQKLMQNLGSETFLEFAFKYINDDSDKRALYEFLHDLNEVKQ